MPPLTAAQISGENDVINLAGNRCPGSEGKESSADPNSPVVTDDMEEKSTAVLRLSSVYTNGLSDERIQNAASVLVDESLTANEKLTEIDKLVPFPPNASAQTLGDLVGKSKQAVMKTDWWIRNRRGQRNDEIARREAGHFERSKQHEPRRIDDRED